MTVNAVDFGDLLLHNLTLFTGNPDILADYQRRFRYLLVDEYQDTNVAQYLWLRLLAQQRRNLCCVGDDDQSIYSWRGAEIGNILRFEKDFPGAHDRPARAELPLDAAHPRRRRRHDRAEPGPPRQDACGPTRDEGEKVVVRGRVGRRGGGALGRRRDRGAAAQAARAQRDRDPGARRLPDARVRRALHHARRCPIASSAGRASTSARRSATRSPICASSISRPTISPSSASSTRRAAASAPPPCRCCTRCARAERLPLDRSGAAC